MCERRTIDSTFTVEHLIHATGMLDGGYLHSSLSSTSPPSSNDK